jgi:Domain of unknown function (DUF5655)
MKEEPKVFDIKSHFDGKEEVVRQTYDELLKVLRKRYPITESPKRKSIHLMHATTLAGVTTRQNSLILTIKSDCMLTSPRIRKSEQVSRNRFHLKLKLSSPEDVNPELIGWLVNAYSLSAGEPVAGEK